MANIIVKIPNVVWRGGRPRFSPGPALRALGFRGEDLRHDDGRWYDLAEAARWSEAKAADIARLRQAPAGALPLLRPVKGAPVTLGELVARALRRPEYRGEAIVDGKRRRRPKSKGTVRFYQGMSRTLQSFDAELWAAPAAALSPLAAEGLLERIEAARGLATARGVRALLSVAYTREGKAMPNPVKDLELPELDPRVRAGEIEEMQALMAAADRIGLPFVGDCILLGLMSGQRQADRLALEDGGLIEGRYLFRQRKTGAVVMVPPTRELQARLAAAKARRKHMVVQWPHAVINEATGRPYVGGTYNRDYRLVRTEASQHCASIADFQDRDLRDTAVTWLARAGCTIPEICAITGHSEKSAYTILKHYLARHPEMADHAIAKMVAWLEAKGVAL
ncbi:MAG: hypothetical protein AB7S41_11330 [Parvibaculaceae bacterium]